jgi:hypothetical protein
VSNRRKIDSTTRGSVLDMLGGVLEGLHRDRSTLGQSDEELPNSRPQSDFLTDFLRLNVQYVNQLARLGSNYSVVAARALERLYDYWQPLSESEVPDAIRLEAVEQETVVARIWVENETDEDLSYTVSTTEFKVEDEAVGLFSELKPAYQHPKRSRARSITLRVEANQRVEVRLALVISKVLVLGAEYRGLVVVTRSKSPSGEYDKETTRHALVLKRLPS